MSEPVISVKSDDKYFRCIYINENGETHSIYATKGGKVIYVSRTANKEVSVDDELVTKNFPQECIEKLKGFCR